MPLSICDVHTDASHREIKSHGTPQFPLACYDDDLRKTSVPWHWHDEFEAIVMQEGRLLVIVDSEKIMLYPGDGLFINSGRLHSMSALADSPCKYITVVFHPRLVGGSHDSVYWQNYVQPLMNNLQLTHLRLARERGCSEAIQAIESAWQCCIQEAPGYEFETRSHLSRLVFQLRRMQSGAQPLPGNRGYRNAERIKTMLQFIQKHFSEEISTREIARSAAVSESECLRCFHNAIDETPIQYLRRYRIERASVLLLSTDMRISEIGAACGFQEMSYFAKSFREAFGCTPSQYRKQQ